MQDCSERMEYEEAARYRDLLISVKQIAQKQKITADDATDRDVIACDGRGRCSCTGILYKTGQASWT